EEAPETWQGLRIEADDEGQVQAVRGGKIGSDEQVVEGVRPASRGRVPRPTVRCPDPFGRCPGQGCVDGDGSDGSGQVDGDLVPDPRDEDRGSSRGRERRLAWHVNREIRHGGAGGLTGREAARDKSEEQEAGTEMRPPGSSGHHAPIGRPLGGYGCSTRIVTVAT